MPLQDIIPPPVTPAMLAADGMLPGEIALALGMTEADVRRELGDAWVQPAHLARVEAGLIESALPGVTWREVADKAGGTMRLESERRPDVQAAKAVLAARMPAMYGQDAAPPIRVVVDVRAALPDGYVRSDADAARFAALKDVTPRNGALREKPTPTGDGE